MSHRTPSHPVVLLHGLLSTPREFGLISLRLRAAGVRLITPVVEGYTEADRRRPRTWAQWTEAAERAIEASLPAGTPFVLGGLCSGALIAAVLASRQRYPVTKLVMLSPTFDFNGWAQPRRRHWRRLGYALHLERWISVPERAPYGIKNPKLRAWVERDMRERAGSAAGPARLPLWAIAETERMKAHVLKALPELHLPALVVHARDDEVCSLQAVQTAFDAIPAQAKKLIVLEDSYHMITLDNDRERVAKEIAAVACGPEEPDVSIAPPIVDGRAARAPTAA